MGVKLKGNPFSGIDPPLQGVSTAEPALITADEQSEARGDLSRPARRSLWTLEHIDKPPARYVTAVSVSRVTRVCVCVCAVSYTHLTLPTSDGV